MPLSEEVKRVLSLEDKHIPTYEELNQAYAVLIDEFILKVRDRIENGNIEEVVKAVGAAEHLDQLGYAINHFQDNEDKVNSFFSKREMEELVEKTVATVYEKVQEEDTNAVARKMKLAAAEAAAGRSNPKVVNLDQADKT